MSWEFERQYIGTVTASGGVIASGARFTMFDGADTDSIDGHIEEQRWNGEEWIEQSRFTALAADMSSTYSTWFSAVIASPSGNRALVMATRKAFNTLGTYYDGMMYKRTGGIWALEQTIPLYQPFFYWNAPYNMFSVDETEVRITTTQTALNYKYYTVTYANSTWTAQVGEQTYTPSPTVKGALQLAFTGRDVMAVSSHSVVSSILWSSFAYWDSRTDYEHLSSGYNFDNGTFGLASNPGYIVYPFVEGLNHTNVFIAAYFNKVYVLAKDHILRIDSDTRLPEGIITTVPQSASSNICVVKNKIYVSGLEQNSDETQKLHIFNTDSSTWSSVSLPGRHQKLRRHIIDGLDGSVWITNRNNHGIIRVSIETDAVLATIRVNRHPYRLSVNQSKELFVASDAMDGWIPRKFYDPDLVGGTVSSVGGGQVDGIAGTPYKIVDTEDVTDGMITTINQADNSQVNLAAARCNGYSNDGKYWDPQTTPTDKDFFDDGQGYIWVVTDGQMGRLKKTDLELKTTFSEKESTAKSAQYNMIPDNGTITRFVPEGQTIMSSLVTPPIQYQRYENGSFVDYNVKPYIFAITPPPSGDYADESFVFVCGDQSQTFTIVDESYDSTAKRGGIVREGTTAYFSVSFDLNLLSEHIMPVSITHISTSSNDLGTITLESVSPVGTASYDPVAKVMTVTKDCEGFQLAVPVSADSASNTNPTVYAARCSALVRKNKYIVRGTAMISIGDQTYYGE